MGEAIGEVLGNAAGVLLSPLPLVALIMVVMAPAGRTKGSALLGGWLLGLAVVLGVFSSVGPLFSGDGPGVAASLVKLVAGAAFLVLAGRAWSSRPRAGIEPEMPRWMTRIQQASTPTCLGAGLFLAGINPKNLGLTAAAGGTVGAADLSLGGAVVVSAVFVVVASLAMMGVLGFALLAPERSAPLLEELRGWLVQNNSVVMLVVLLLVGVRLVGDALPGLL